jgi:hypothetical protein
VTGAPATTVVAGDVDAIITAIKVTVSVNWPIFEPVDESICILNRDASLLKIVSKFFHGSCALLVKEKGESVVPSPL